MGVTESKEDQKLQEIWAVVDEDSDEEDKLKKRNKNKINQPNGTTATSGPSGGGPPSTTSSSSSTSVPTRPVPTESPFPGIRLRTEDDGDVKGRSGGGGDEDQAAPSAAAAAASIDDEASATPGRVEGAASPSKMQTKFKNRCAPPPTAASCVRGLARESLIAADQAGGETEQEPEPERAEEEEREGEADVAPAEEEDKAKPAKVCSLLHQRTPDDRCASGSGALVVWLSRVNAV
jgi:hypothetical protein